MIKAQAGDKKDQYANHLGPRIKAMYPCISVEVKENVHFQTINEKLTIQN